MTFNWCHGPNCHTKETQSRVRGSGDNKVLRTIRIKQGRYNWNNNNSITYDDYFCHNSYPILSIVIVNTFNCSSCCHVWYSFVLVITIPLIFITLVLFFFNLDRCFKSLTPWCNSQDTC